MDTTINITDEGRGDMKGYMKGYVEAVKTTIKLKELCDGKNTEGISSVFESIESMDDVSCALENALNAYLNSLSDDVLETTLLIMLLGIGCDHLGKELLGDELYKKAEIEYRDVFEMHKERKACIIYIAQASSDHLKTGLARLGWV